MKIFKLYKLQVHDSIFNIFILTSESLSVQDIFKTFY